MTGPTETPESRGRARPEAPEHSPTVLVYPVEALIRDDNAGGRAFSVTRRFVRLVSEFDASSYAAVNFRTGGEQGRLDLTLELHGRAAHEVTKADLVSALGGAVVLGDPTPHAPSLPDVATAYELVRTTVAPFSQSSDNYDFGRPEWAPQPEVAGGPGFATPLPNENDSAESLLAAMARSDKQLWVRTTLGAADDLSARMVVDELNSSMTRYGVADNARVPVVARTVVVSSSRVPVAVRAALRQRGNGLRLVPVEPSDVLPLWSDALTGLQSAAVGEMHAVAITRIPAAGTVWSLGVATQRPPAPERPLDPMPPAPAHPIQLGWATDAFGRTVVVECDASDLPRHFFIEGRPGSGKTITLAQFFWSITRAGYQVIYLDPHGDGAARVAAYSSALKGVTTHYIRHGDLKHPVRINPTAGTKMEARERVLSELLELIQNMLDPKREGMVGERFKRTFSLVDRAAHEVFGARTSITDVLALTLTKESLRALAHAVQPKLPDAASRLEAEIISLGDKEFADLVSWFVSRLQPFLRTPALREILGTGEDSVDILDLLDSGKNLIVDLASLELGEDVARVLGALWLFKVRNAMGYRTDRKRPIVLLIDEAHLYTFGALPGLLAEARKFGIGIVVATQAADNLTPGLARAIEANCGSAISLRTGINAASSASERLGGWPPMQLTRLEDLTAAASLSRSGVPTPAFTLHIDHLKVVAQEGWDDSRITSASARVAEESSELLWAPFADRKVLNDAEVVASVKAASIAWRRAHGGDGPEDSTVHRPARDRTASLLDNWLRTRDREGLSGENERFDVILDDTGASSIEVIKIIREFTGMGLAEAKAASERTSSVLVRGGDRDKARALLERLRATGAEARIIQRTAAPQEGAR